MKSEKYFYHEYKNIPHGPAYDTSQVIEEDVVDYYD